MCLYGCGYGSLSGNWLGVGGEILTRTVPGLVLGIVFGEVFDLLVVGLCIG